MDTGETPFSLTYMMEEVIVDEKEVATAQTGLVNYQDNGRTLQEVLDLVDEKRESVLVRNTCFQPGKLVLRKAFENKKKRGREVEPQLGKTLSGYITIGHGGIPIARELDEKKFPRAWNASHLKAYYW